MWPVCKVSINQLLGVVMTYQTVESVSEAFVVISMESLVEQTLVKECFKS